MDSESKFNELPVGLGMALAQNPAAFEHFSTLSRFEKEGIILKASNVNSKAEMQNIINDLCR